MCDKIIYGKMKGNTVKCFLVKLIVAFQQTVSKHIKNIGSRALWI